MGYRRDGTYMNDTYELTIELPPPSLEKGSTSSVCSSWAEKDAGA
jgi:hypothetical protein